MKKIGHCLAVVFIIAAITLCSCAEQQKRSVESRIDALFSQWDKPDSPGVALAVIREGKIVYSNGYGIADLEHDVPITPETVFYIGSTSKQFVAMCILLLEEEGKLALDDDIRKYLPEFPSYESPITIRHLIHHTSGIRDYLTLWSLAGKDALDFMPEDAVYDMLCRQKELNFSPGEQHMYSNSCYFLLAMIVRSASGNSLREYAEEKIFLPLGMNATHFHDDVTHIIKNRAFSYSQNPDGEFGNLHMRFSLVGSGGLYTSVKDLFAWDQNFYDNRLGQKRPELIEKMHQNGRLNNGKEVNYAFALNNGTYRDLRTVAHGGALAGYRAELLRFPDQQFSIAILGNHGGINPSQLAYSVADIYLEELLGEQVAEVEPDQATGERKEITIEPSLLDAYVGRYQLGPGFIIEITKENGRLMALATGQPKIPLFPESATKFFLKVTDAQVTFQPDQNRLILHQGGADMPASKLEAPDLTPDQLNQYAGDYFSDEVSATYRISLEGNELYLKVGYNPRAVLSQVREDEFSSRFAIFFQRNGKGEITGFEIDAGRVQNLKFIKR